MLSPLKIALRRLATSPSYTLVALGTLALGIGVNSSMFSVIDALLFRSGPFPQPEQIVQVLGVTRQGEMRQFSADELREIREQATSFAALATIGYLNFALSEPGRPAERFSGISVSPEVFATFGIQPLLGRTFAAEESRPGRNQVVLLSHAFWQQRYGGARTPSAAPCGSTARA